jgi:hypothetical protein
VPEVFLLLSANVKNVWNYSAFLSSLFLVPQLSRDVALDVDFLCGQAVSLSVAVKGRFCIYPFLLSSYDVLKTQG